MSARLARPLVGGAGGFIGHYLTRALAARDDVETVYAVDIPGSARLARLAELPKVVAVECDLLDPSNLAALPDDVTAVFALAALNGTARFYTQPFTVLMGSSLPTVNLIDRYKSIAPVVYSSSSEVYASTVELFGGAVPTPEDISPSIADVSNPRWSYATAKLLGEVAMTAAAVEHGMPGVVVRYHNVYGPDMGTDHFVPDFVERARRGVFEIRGGSETRAFLYIDDAVEATIMSLEHASTDVPLFHLGSDDEITIHDAARVVMDELGKSDEELTVQPALAGSVSRRCADTNRSREVLGWVATTSLRDGVQRYLAGEA